MDKIRGQMNRDHWDWDWESCTIRCVTYCLAGCVAGESISPLLPSVVRGKVIATATDESDITEDDWQAEYMKAFGTPPPKEQLYDDEHHHQAVQSASSAAFGDVFTGVQPYSESFRRQQASSDRALTKALCS